MDLSYWHKIPKIQVEPTLKQYYKQYLWKMTVYAPGGRLVQEPLSSDLATMLQYRRDSAKMYNHSGWWGLKNNQLVNANLELLDIIRRIKNDSTYNVKIRVEEPSIQFYASDESELKKIATVLKPFLVVTHIYGPADDQSKELLESGVIIRKSPVEYRYKVVCRDGRYPTGTKRQILNYLDGLGDTVKVLKGARKMLNNGFDHSWNVYFYTNDISILTFINLIAPTLVSNIHELVVLPNK
jgi:hypothetical protein